MKIVIDINEELLLDNSSTPELTSMFMHIEHDEESYPCDDWIDNPSVVLGWWLYSFNEIASGGEGQGFNFMEGPFFINSKYENESLALTSEDREFSCTIGLIDFGEQLCKAMNQASRIFYKMGIKPIAEGFDKEVATLKQTLSNLEKSGSS